MNSVLSRLDNEIAFDTYRFYLECVTKHILENYKTWEKFATYCSDETSHLQGVRNLNTNWIKPKLKIAWNTEFLLSFDHSDPELIKANNQWLPIQTYYSIFSACEALCYVLDEKIAGGHIKTMDKVSEFIVTQNISPWNKAYDGPLGQAYNRGQAINFPDDLIPSHNLERRNVKPLNMIAACLKAEHKNRIKDTWERNKKQLQKRGLRKYQYNPGRTTLFHFIYRLRIQSNYRKVDIFLASAPINYIVNFASDLKTLTFYTLSIIEIILMKRIGKKAFLEIAHSYLVTNPKAQQLEDRTSWYKTM